MQVCVCVCLMWQVTQPTATWVKAHSWRRWKGQVSEATTFSLYKHSQAREKSVLHTQAQIQMHVHKCKFS